MAMNETVVRCRLAGMEFGGDQLEFVYIPDYTQVLLKDRRYRFVVRVDGGIDVAEVDT